MRVNLVMQVVSHDGVRGVAESVSWCFSKSLFAILILASIVLVLVSIALVVSMVFESDWLEIRVETFLLKITSKKGVKELQELVGKSTSRWIFLNIFIRGSIDGVDEGAIAELTLPEKRFFVVIESFIMNPARYRFIYDYDEVIQSTYAMNVVFKKESSITDSEFWDARREVIDEMWGQFLDEMGREEEKTHTMKELELEVVKRRTEDDMRDLEDLKRFRGQL